MFIKGRQYHISITTFPTQQFLHHPQMLHYDVAPDQVSHHVPYPPTQTVDTDVYRCIAAQSGPSRLALFSSHAQFQRYQQRHIF